MKHLLTLAKPYDYQYFSYYCARDVFSKKNYFTFKNKYMLVTKRLVMKPYLLSDVDLLHPILSDKTTMKFWPQPFSKAQTLHWLQRNITHYYPKGFGRYGVYLKENEQQLIGDCGIMLAEVNGQEAYDIGYIFHHPYWGNGYAMEAALAWKNYAFEELKLQQIVANMPTNHLASAKVAERIGLQLQKRFVNTKNRNFETFLYIAVNHNI